MAEPPIWPRDRLGRQQKDWHRLFHGIEGAVSLANWMPPRPVPPEYWSLDATESGEMAAVIACPCGNSPIVPPLEPLLGCCQRYYFFDGTNVWAWKGPSEEVALPADPSQADGTSTSTADHRDDNPPGEGTQPA